MPDPDFIVIERGDVYAPEALGRVTVLTMGRSIRLVGEADVAALANPAWNVTRLDARECLVIPALIDVHEHLIGGSGEAGGFNTQSPEIFLHELLAAGIATVVGCLGTDTVTRTMPALLGKVKALREQGLNAFLYTGGYPVPAATLTGSVDRDILFFDEVIGAGELAISDYRSSAPSTAELARVVRQASVAGMLSGKAGVTHFHVGEDESRLQPLRDLIEHHAITPESLYPTHVERTEKLFDEAIELTSRGATVDVDVVEGDLAKWLRHYRERDGDPSRLTASSDAAVSGPGTLLEQIMRCIAEGIPVERVLMLTTSNPARVLRLPRKGSLRAGCDADIAVVDYASGTVRHLLANGRIMVRDGLPAVTEEFLNRSNRRIQLYGQKN